MRLIWPKKWSWPSSPLDVLLLSVLESSALKLQGMDHSGTVTIRHDFVQAINQY